MLTVKQVAERLGVCERTVYALVASGALMHYRIGSGRGVIRVSDEALRHYLETCRGATTRPERPRRRTTRKLRHITL
jgi:excisionase family DNA binding protein